MSASPAAAAFAFGAYARVHLLDFASRRDRLAIGGRFDVYVGAGWDFVAPAGGRYRWAGIDGEINYNGFAFPFSAGVDFYVHEHVAVGLLGQWSPWTAFQQCSTVQIGGFSRTDCNSPREAEHYFFVGAGVRGHFHLGG